MFQTPTCRCTLTSITPPCPAATVQIEDLLGLFYHSIIPAIPCVTRAIVVFLCQPWRLEATPRATATALQWEEPFKSNPPCLRLPAQREHEAELLVEEGISLEPLLEVRSLCSQFPQPLFEKGGQKKKEVPAPTHESVLCPKRRH